jgi:hypothetical protein
MNKNLCRWRQATVELFLFNLYFTSSLFLLEMCVLKKPYVFVMYIKAQEPLYAEIDELQELDLPRQVFIMYIVERSYYCYF